MTYLSMLGVRMLPLLLQMRLLHVMRQTDLAHRAISHGGELGGVHIHVHGHSVGSHVPIAHLLGHDALLLEGTLLLLQGYHVRVIGYYEDDRDCAC